MPFANKIAPEVLARSANGAALYQHGATPHEAGWIKTGGLKARAILSAAPSCAGNEAGLSALDFAPSGCMGRCPMLVWLRAVGAPNQRAQYLLRNPGFFRSLLRSKMKTLKTFSILLRSLHFLRPISSQ
jgi:hypothetical protein